MKHGHQFDGVSACPTQVGYRRALDTSTTRVRKAVLCVPFKKYYFLTRTRIGHCLDACQTWLDTARIQPKHDLVLFFFQLFDRPKKNSKAQKLKFI